MARLTSAFLIVLSVLAGVLWWTSREWRALREPLRELSPHPPPRAPAEPPPAALGPAEETDESAARRDPAPRAPENGVISGEGPSGTVVDARGHPVAGALVRLYRPARDDGWYPADSGDDSEPEVILNFESCTNESGAFTFPALPPGPVQGEVHAPERLPHFFALDLPAGAPLRIELPLPGIIEGKAALETGELFEGATVTAEAGVFIGHAESGPDGRYRLEVPPRRSVGLVASFPGYAPLEERIPEGLAAGERREQDFTFPQGAAISGVVLEPDGQPAAAAELELVRDRDEREWKVTADRAGRFLFTGVPPGDFRIRAESERGAAVVSPRDGSRAGGGEPTGASGIAARSARFHLHFVVNLGAWAEISGRVLDPEDRPVAGAVVVVSPDHPHGSREVETGSAGEFHARVPAGTEYALGVAAPRRFPSFGGWGIAVDGFPPLGPGERKTDHELRHEGPREVTVVVTGEDGNPIEGAWVAGTAGPIPMRSFSWGREPSFGDIERHWTRPDGSLSMCLWPELWYYLEVRAPGYQVSYLDLRRREYGGLVEKVVLRRTCQGIALAGVVVSSRDGSPIAGATITGWFEPNMVPGPRPEYALVESSERCCLLALTDGSGRFALRGIDSERCTLEAAAEGFLPSDPVPAGAGDGDLRIVLEPGLAVEGQVVLSSGEPVPGVSVSAGGRSARTSAEGRFRLDGIPHDTAEMTVYGDRIYTAALELPQETSDPLRLEVEERDVFSGAVLGPGGHPLANENLRACLTPSGEEGSIDNELKTDPEGRFRFVWSHWTRRPAPGTLWIRAPGFLAAECPDIEISEFAFTPSENRFQFERGRWAALRLVGEDGRPLAGAVVAEVGSQQSRKATTDAEGRARLGPLRRGKTRVKVEWYRERLESKVFEVDPEAPETVIQVRRHQG